MLIIPALGDLKEEDWRLRVSLGYIVRSCLIEKKKTVVKVIVVVKKPLRCLTQPLTAKLFNCKSMNNLR